MQLQPQDKPAFKQWLLPKLATVSDAEPAVLAEYVAELFSADGSVAEIKRSSREQLSDFLDQHTQTFVDEVATAISQKHWLKKPASAKNKKGGGNGALGEPTRPAHVASTPPTRPKAVATAPSTKRRLPPFSLAPNAPAFVPRAPTGPRAPGRQQPQTTGKNVQNGTLNRSKKRKLHDRETSQSQNGGGDQATGERPYKQTFGRDGGLIGGSRNPVPAAVTSHGLPFPLNSLTRDQSTSLPSFPPADAFNPFSFLNTMSAMMAMSMPGAVISGPGFGAHTPFAPHINPSGAKIRCRNYETKGICMLGTLCPYEHGKPIVVPAVPEYDPNHSSLAMQPHLNGGRTANNDENGNSSRGPKSEQTHAPSLHPGPRRNLQDTVIVEQIPQKYLNDGHVLGFFSQFGTVIQLRIQAHERFAVIKFGDHFAAQRAHDSPKAIFDNRFVKVSWYKPEQLTQELVQDEHVLDMEEFSRHQAQVQKEFEEKRTKAEEVTAQSNMLRAELRAKEEELNRLRSMVTEKARAQGVEAISRREQQDVRGFSKTRGLERLQAEAAKMFAGAELISAPNATRDGHVNGRDSRGGYRGRGGARGGQGGVMRLDNRPHRLAIAEVQPESQKEKALKQYLVNAAGCSSIQPHVEQANTIVVSFDHRYQAESFLTDIALIPHVAIDFAWSWIPNDAVVTQPTDSEPMVLHRDTDDEASNTDEQVEPKVEVDLDVADDLDQWL